MDETYFSYDNVGTIDKILSNNQIMNSFYDKLCTLEIQGKENTQEYMSYLKHLSFCKKTEEELLKKLELEPVKADIIIKYLKFRYIEGEIIPSENSIVKQDNNQRDLRRFLMELINISKCDERKIKNEASYDFIKLGLSDKQTYEFFCKMFSVIDGYKSDLYLSCIYLINEYLKKPEFMYIKEKLIRAKYDISYEDKRVESYMIDNKFKVDISLYLVANLIEDSLSMNRALCQPAKDGYARTIALRHMESLLKINDIDYNEPEKVCEALLRKSFISSSLILMSEQMQERLKERFSYMDLSRENSKISSSLIKECLSEIHNNKKNVKMVSLIPQR